MNRPQDIHITENPIFIHIPKTGGISIVYGLIGYFPLLNCFHKRVSRYDKSLRERQFVFSFVRNPYDRIVSSYHYLIQGLGNPADNEFGASLPKDFKTFVIDYMRHIDISSPDLQLHLLPMTFWLNEDIDFIGKFENLQEDYNYVCQQLNIPIHQLNKTNASDHKDYREYYDNETRQIIESIYYKDITQFNYTF